jgi:ABC-type nitrate/sulfonate/bicarbonate transport system substrate-binding protein
MTIRPLVATPSRTLFALPYWIAVHRDFFKAEGLAPDLEFVAGGELINEGLRNGRITMAIGPPDGVMLDVLAGGPLRILAGNACKPPLFVMAQPEIRSAADLRGKTFGVLSLREGSSKFIEKFARTGGLKPGDYRVVEVGGAPARVKLLAERTIDAGLQPMPLNYELEARGFSNLGWTGEFEPHYQFTSFNASRDLVQREASLAAAMLRAMLRGQRFASAHPDEACGILASELGCEQSHALKALQDTSRLGIFDPDLNWSGPGLERIFRNLQEDGAVPAGTRFELERHVLADSLRQAQADRP